MTTAAVFITKTNCEAATGMCWSWIFRFAKARGIPVGRFGRKACIKAAPLMAALEEGPEPSEDTTSLGSLFHLTKRKRLAKMECGLNNARKEK